MSRISAIARYTFIEYVRNRIFYGLALFGTVLVIASLLLSALGGQQTQRILLDLGAGAVELFALLAVVFAAVTIVLEEMEARTIYLVLTRPVSRAQYLVGRYAGLLAAVYAGMLLMAAMHMGALLLKGWEFQARYVIALLLSAEKIFVIGSLALFFSLFSSSAVSSLSFTVLFWVLGHFSGEMSFLGGKVANPLARWALGAFYYAVPNMQYFNLRDFWDVPGVMGGWLWLSAAYGLLYGGVLLSLSALLFRRKEF